MRVRKQIPTMVNPQAPGLARYFQGPILTNGALEFIYEKPVTWPLYTYWGNGIRTLAQMNVLQADQLRTVPAVTTVPIYGAGVPASSIALQRLLAEAEAQHG